MAYKVLGQSSPSATTATDLYTVPSGKSAVVSSLAICNQNTTAATYRVSIRVAGASDDPSQYLAYDSGLPGTSSDLLTIGITLADSDVVTVYASTADVSFNLFGDES